MPRPVGRPKGSFNKATIKADGNKPRISVTEVFAKNQAAVTPIIINRGGARSSKSYSIIQILTEKFFSLQGRKILMLRKTLPSLRKSTYRDFQDYLELLSLLGRVDHSKLEMCFNYGRSLVQFGCLDEAAKIKSTEWNDIFMEEATEFTYEDFVILRTRLSGPTHKTGKNEIKNKLYMAFNPEDENHWIKSRVIDSFSTEKYTEIPSSYKDNPFLSKEYIQSLLELEEQDPNYYRIYALGEWGKLEHRIYSNWDVVRHFPNNCEEVLFGLDFGFNSPSALVKVGMKDEEFYLEEMLYQTRLNNSELIGKINELMTDHQKRNSYLFCDSAEPDKIKEIEDAGFLVVPADKSVKDGIDTVKRHKLHIVDGSDNLLKEIKSYSWKMDRKTERILDEPVKFNDHSVDAIRYAVYTFYKQYGIGPRVAFL